MGALPWRLGQERVGGAKGLNIAVQGAVSRRTFAQATEARSWQESAVSALWERFAMDPATCYRLDLLHAARVLALTEGRGVRGAAP